MSGYEIHDDPSPPATLGDAYDVVRELGRGGMAVVYLARERTTGREYAVKVIHSRFVGDPEAVARFAREARLVAQLHHPGIVPIHSVVQLDGGALALVMEWIPGRTVKQIIQESGAMPFDQVERILRDISEALEYAHAQGVVHRDVKPENIFIDEASGRALLSDFGIARSIDSETQLTLAGVAIGTPTYMAPEQIDGSAVDSRSDLYSLGVVGWEMLAGERPWKGETLYNVIYRQKHDELPAIETLRPDAPTRLVGVIEGLLEKNSSDRWQTAAEFRNHLTSTLPVVRRAHALRSDTTSDTIIIRRPAAQPIRSRVRSMLLGVAPVAIVAGLLVSATLLFARSQPDPARHPAAIRASLADEPVHRVIRARAVSVPVVTPLVDDAVAAAENTARSALDDSVEDGAVEDDTAPQVPTLPASPPASAIATSVASSAVAASAGDHVMASPPAAVRAPGPTGATVAHHVTVASGASHTCLLSDDGAPFCWGGNTQGQLGTSGALGSAVPAGVTTAIHFTSLASGLTHTCALAISGDAYCWGGNDHGELGDGSRTSRAAPVRVAGGRDFVMIATGATHSCALTDAGHAFCWGAGADGQLGNRGARDSAVPVAVNASVMFSSLVTGWNHTCALTSDGAAYCWGANDGGELGDGTTTNRSEPTRVHTDVRFVALNGGSSHTCGIAQSGAVYCWGENRYGQLGDGTTVARLTPTPVDGGRHFVAISTGGVHTCALTADHTAWCWGRNNHGQLGDGYATDRTTPTRVAGNHNFMTISAFGAHTCGTTTTDELFCWGYNLQGQLGDGTREHRLRPVYVEKPAT